MNKLNSRIIQIEENLKFRFNKVPLRSQIRLLNTFTTAYFQIFGQVMPTKHIDYVNKRVAQTYARILKIPNNCYQETQLLQYVGAIPANFMVERLKVLYLKKRFS